MNGLLSRVVDILCCRDDYCRRCFETLTIEQRKEKKLTKDDIQHPVLLHQPVKKLDSLASSKGSSGGSNPSSRLGSSSGYYSTAQNSPVFPKVFIPREKKDSESSTFSPLSRKDSSSSVPDSPASFGKKCVTPVIDMKPIEFWTANRETVQPRPPKRRLPSESEISIEDFNPDIYDDDVSEDCLTDEQKLAMYKLGQLHFYVQYDINEKILIVRVVEARALPLQNSQDKQTAVRSNPYIKICLLPGQKDSRQTSVQRKTQSPVWNETFNFQVPFSEVQSRSLEFTVKDFDKFSRHCVIGKVTINLSHVQLVKGSYMLKPLHPSTQVSHLHNNSQISSKFNVLIVAVRSYTDVPYQ